MGTEVLRSQDCIGVAPAIFHHRKRYGVPKINRKPVRSVKPEQRRKSPETTTDNDLRPQNLKNGGRKVTILVRGESIYTKIKSNQKNRSDEMKVITGRSGPDTKQIRLGLPDTYAGSAFSTSPAPSSLPLPSFFRKDGVKAAAAAVVVDDLAATRDLRRLLRLDL